MKSAQHAENAVPEVSFVKDMKFGCAGVLVSRQGENIRVLRNLCKNIHPRHWKENGICETNGATRMRQSRMVGKQMMRREMLI